MQGNPNCQVCGRPLAYNGHYFAKVTYLCSPACVRSKYPKLFDTLMDDKRKPIVDKRKTA